MILNRKIMGMPLITEVEEDNELRADSIIRFADEIYRTVQDDYGNKVSDSNRLRAIAVYRLVSELLAIKGEKEVFLDTNTRKIDDLIKKIDSLNLQN